MDLDELKRLLEKADDSDIDLLRCDNALRNAAPQLIQELEALREYYEADKAAAAVIAEDAPGFHLYDRAMRRLEAARSRVEEIRRKG